MHERKKIMADSSRGFVALPGGYGTLEEFAEVTTWTQLAIHKKPVVLLNILGFYTPIRAFIESAIEAGFILESNRSLIVFVDAPEGEAATFDWGAAALKAIEDWEARGMGGGVAFSLEWADGKAPGVYSELCRSGERHRDPENGRWIVCEAQDLKLGLLFTVASVATSVAGLPTGMVLDKLGPRTSTIIGAVLVALGAASFGAGYQSPAVDSYLIGYFLIAIGGPLVCLSSFHLSNAFPAHAGVVLAAVTGSFDASSIPFVIYEWVYRSKEVSLRRFFWGYLIIPLSLIIEQTLIAPEETYQRQAPTKSTEHVPTETDPLIPPPEASLDPENLAASMIASGFSQIHLTAQDDEGLVTALKSKDTLTGTLYGMTAVEQLKTSWFWALTFFVAVHMTRINFYILSIDTQLQDFTGSRETAESLTRIFSVMLPIGGIAGIPVVGLLLDRLPFLHVMLVTLGLGVAFGVFGMTGSVALQIVGFGAFVVFRPLLYTAVSEAVAKIMGFKSFGTIYGAAMTLAGFVALLNVPLDVLVKSVLKSYIPVDLAFLALGIVSSGTVAFLIWRQTKLSQ
ncbi:hypothetical protein MNV49_001859 [Pseudohyphozyma bogoriensis]|nr:hypothetical protein MNV49_001859 [Pseudohyphozyma bogoriensis]